ncbi:MAG TPA: NAD(P)-binding domain-containing protein [Actinomycetota bacterium]|nr:NAD(P)-binding domain-containing protein [Actinomycetota bacterium]
MSDLPATLPVVVIGGGQAGLATSSELTRRGVEHTVLERGRIGSSWRGRWDSFCLVTPNWSLNLPGFAYAGDDPDGYLPRDGIVGHLEDFARSFGAPVHEEVDVTSVRPSDDGLVLTTSAGTVTAGRVVVASGTYRRPHRPSAAAALPPGLLRLDADGYRNPGDLPEGRILVVGSGQTGCQLSEELHRAGRDVVLSCGRAPWMPRRFGGHDVVWWGSRNGFLDMTLESLPSPMARLSANVLATGRDGGHDLHLRTLREMGVTLAGHLVGADDRAVRFEADLGDSVAWGDARFAEFRALSGRLAAELGIDTGLEDPEPFDARGAPQEVDLAGIAAVVFTGGFRPDYASWIAVDGAFDELGFPRQLDGISLADRRLAFVGVHFQRVRKSSLFWGVGEDAAIVAEAITTT